MSLFATTRYAKLTADYARNPQEGKPYTPELYNTFREILSMLAGINIIGGSGITVNENGGTVVISITPPTPGIPTPSITNTIPDWGRIFLSMGA